MTRLEPQIINQPHTSSANQCLTSETSGCPQKWDTFLCWPQSEADSVVAIPCNASHPFVEIVTETRPSLTKELIPGLAYHFCQPDGHWANKTDYSECTTFLVSIGAYSTGPIKLPSDLAYAPFV